MNSGKPSAFASGALYLLRFDDLCPTQDWARWKRFQSLLFRFGIRPILAIVPDNQDPELQQGPYDPFFWDDMRTLEGAGATIGLHGYQHLCNASGRSLVDLHRRTEFAGAPFEWQSAWIRDGLMLLRKQRLTPKVWVAPRHGSDWATLKALREQGIDTVSDGLATVPYLRAGLTWIPQQLWAPVVKDSGVWTISYHPNTATDSAVSQLEAFLYRFAGQFTSVETLLNEWPLDDYAIRDRLSQASALLRIRLSRFRRKLLSG